MLINSYTRFSSVEGLGDELIPWWLAPYVRNFAALAKSTVVLQSLSRAAAPEPSLAAFARRIAETAAVARVAAHVKGNDALGASVNATLAAEIEEFCGTPPHPHRLDQAALAVSLIASSLEANDPAKTALVNQAERLQQKLQGESAAAAA